MKLSRNPILRSLYHYLQNWIMARNGLQPRGEYFYSSEGHTFKNLPELGIPLPNLSGRLHPIIRQYLDCYDLGTRCLLVSESNMVRAELQKYYPDVTFTTCDYFPELMSGDDSTETVDFKWDVCAPPPEQFIGNPFDSIICYALLEHVMAPTSAMLNFFSILASQGRLYIMTHTPSFNYHPYPRDYVRFHHDYFHDMPTFLEQHSAMKAVLLEMYSSKGFVCLCYRKL